MTTAETAANEDKEETKGRRNEAARVGGEGAAREGGGGAARGGGRGGGGGGGGGAVRGGGGGAARGCLLYTSLSRREGIRSRMLSSAFT